MNTAIEIKQIRVVRNLQILGSLFIPLLVCHAIASNTTAPTNLYANKDLFSTKHSSIRSFSLYEAVSETISERQFFQTRFNFGVNLGGSFVREKWLFPSLFPTGTNTELEAITKACTNDRTRAKIELETHWQTYMRDPDWDWLKSHKVNSVRIPIGYWNIDGGSFTENTLFEPVKDIYVNSWHILKSHYIEPAARRGISVLIDIHGVPGGANPDAHSGEHTGKAEFWNNVLYQQLLQRALGFIAQDLKQYDNVCGIQVVNEAVFSNDAVTQKTFYKNALNEIRKHDSLVPVIISDGWWPNQWVEWIQNELSGETGLVVDHHCYRCFAPADKGKRAEQIIEDLNKDLLTNLNQNGQGVDFMVGEWSCVLSAESWANSGIDPSNEKDPQRVELVAEFGSKEEKLIEERARAGSYFWTYRFESGNGGEWDFRQQLGKSFHPPTISIPDALALEIMKERKLSSILSHSRGQAQSQADSDLLREGFNVGWNDALIYARKGYLIGRKQAVKQARRQQRMRAKGSPTSFGNWDVGYDQGLRELEIFVGASSA